MNIFPVISGSDINDDPIKPVSKYALDQIAAHGDETPIHWIHRTRDMAKNWLRLM